jgi:predicted NUDIX family NTP pyrophosphohydrolase
MNRISAGILLYRFIGKEVEFFLVHPGGPFFKNKDLGHWTIPKGEPHENEDLRSCALREFKEETGIAISGEMIELNPIQQKGGKKVYAWAIDGNLDPSKIVSNIFELEWPYKSGKIQRFPEIDRAGWFNIEISLKKINPAQQSLILQAGNIMHQSL